METGALSAGEVAADTVEIPNCMRVPGGRGVLESIVLLDEADQGVALDLIFFDSNVSLGTKNSAPSITDANARHIISRVPIATADYSDLGSCRVATVGNLGRILRAVAGSRSLYVSVLNGAGTPTFGAAGAVKLKLGFLQS
jgi:hypothetical protein